MLSETPRNDYQDKKLRGSGGYVIAKITDEEQRRGNLGGPDLFLAGVGRLEENRLLKHYCNKCEVQFDGPPSIVYDNPNEDLGEGVILEEKGEYKCKKCKSTIAQYRKFRSPQNEKAVPVDSSSTVTSKELNQKISSTKPKEQPTAIKHSANDSMHEVHNALVNGEFLPINSLIEMPAYDSEAMLIGNIKEIGLRRLKNGTVDVSIMVNSRLGDKDAKAAEILWSKISKIGDIVLINENQSNVELDSHNGTTMLTKCKSCGYSNEEGSKYCEECGSKL
jgi:sporulation protein YlmC with PRC-barrel domain